MTYTPANMWSKEVTGNENAKIVFRAYLREEWIDLRQTKTKNDPRAILEYISPVKRVMFAIFVHLSQIFRSFTTGTTYTLMGMLGAY